MVYIFKNKRLEHFSEVRLQGNFACKPEGFFRKPEGYFKEMPLEGFLYTCMFWEGLLRSQEYVGTSGASLRSCKASVVVDIQWKIQHLFKDIATIVGVITWN